MAGKELANSFTAEAQFQIRGTSVVWTLILIPLLCGIIGKPESALAAQTAGGRGLASNVDPLIGTGKGPGGSENLFPGAVMPFGMVQLSPDTQSHGYGYHYYQRDIQGFSMTHMSGPGCANEGDVFFTATTGPILTRIRDFESPYSHSDESSSPGYYQVRLSRWGIEAQLTATNRTGVARFTFPAGKPANFLVPISHTLNYTTAAEVRVVNNNQIIGYVEDRAFCGNHQTYKVYFDMSFSRPFSSHGTWRGILPRERQKAHRRASMAVGTPSGQRHRGMRPLVVANGGLVTQTRHRQWVGAYASWPATDQPQTITVRIGISYVDIAGAKNNLKVEAAAKSFAQIRRDARAAWNKALSVIQVKGGTAEAQRVFYTALYHSLLMPSIFSDADGRYLGFDGKIHHVAPGHRVYCNYSGWDIYRSEMPLLALIEPQRMEDMAQSVVLMYQQGGWIGRWPQINLYTNVMAGSPLTTVLCMAWLDGLHNFNIKAAWTGMVKDATEAPPPGHPYRGEAGIKWINQLHYVPNDKVRYGSVSQIQEDCIAYASLYRLAVKLGKTHEANVLYQRALYYRNVFDPQDRFFRPRNSDGKWTPEFNPARQGPDSGFIEGSGWHYQWLAPSDLAWLIHAVGEKRFNRRLRAFFSYAKPGWQGQYYNPYNEPDLEAPFEFNFSQQPWETERVVRRILRQNYTTSPNGIPGNDDCGEMSSWAVLSMMGIYTVDPASLAYELVSPVFSKIIIHLHPPYTGKTFTIRTPSHPQAKRFIHEVKLNGHKRRQDWIPFADVRAGGTLEFVLGSKPDKSWGSAPEDAPPPLSQAQP